MIIYPHKSLEFYMHMVYIFPAFYGRCTLLSQDIWLLLYSVSLIICNA